MNSLYQKIQKVETLQNSIDREIKIFKTNSGIDCPRHCSECCNYQDIMATPLEFLPFAWHAFKIGQLDYWFDELERSPDEQRCVFYRGDTQNWGCQIYPTRGLICRLFGFSAITDKTGKPVYGACKVLKQQKIDLVNKTRELISQRSRIPVMAHQYSKLASIEPVWGNELLPINQAIKKSLEIIYFHFAYAACA